MDFPVITWENGSRQPTFLIVLGILLVVSIAAVCGRFYCRICHVNYFGLDDCFIAVSIGVTIALAVMNIFHIRYGTGLHVTDLPLDPVAALIPTLKYWYAYQIIYPLALLFVKLSFLALYWRIFGQTRTFRILIYAVAAFVLAYTVVVMFVNAFECGGNLSQPWDPTFPQGCIDLPTQYFTTASINIATDIVILVLPIRPLLRLQMNARKRYALIAVFMIGAVAVVASIVRLHALYIYLTTEDVSYDAIFILLWSQIEINLAITCASIPTLRPLFANTFGSTSSYFSRQRRGQSTGPIEHTASHTRVTPSRSRKSGPVELYSLSGRGMSGKTRLGANNDSEEMILGKDSGSTHISRTVETSVSTTQGPYPPQNRVDKF